MSNNVKDEKKDKEVLNEEINEEKDANSSEEKKTNINTEENDTKENEADAMSDSTEEVSAEDLEDEENGENKKESKKFFGKKDKEKDKLKEQINELNDKVMRQMAEFENFRNRSQKEKDAMFDMGAKNVIEKILPVIDNFERGLAGLSEEAAKEPFAEGMNMIYKQLMGELEKLNVKPIEAVGQEFNPDFHQAVMHVEDEEAGENIVVEELQKGYMYNDSVVRYSMVKVAN